MVDLKVIFFVLAFSLLVSLASGVRIFINVSPRIDGKVSLFNLSQHNPVFFTLHWENVGSVGCKVRMRVEVYSEDKLVYVGWSREKELWPGAATSLLAYAFLEEGNYTVHPYVHHCYLVYDLPPKPLRVVNTSVKKGGVEIVEAKTYENYVKVKIKSTRDLERVVIIPKDYPLGWIFESTLVERIRTGEEREVKVYYEPSIFSEENVTLVAIANDGSFAEKTFTLKIEKSMFQKLWEFLLRFFSKVFEF